MKTRMFWFLTSLMLSFCSSNSEFFGSWIEYVKVVDKDFDGESVYVLIPNAGCPGCLSTAESFLLGNLNSSKVKFVLFQFHSIKDLKIKLGEDVFDAGNVVLDKDGFSDLHGLNSFYPLIVYPKERMLEAISPENPNSISNLLSYISNTID